MAAEGARVVVVDWDEEVAERTAKAIIDAGGECTRLVADVATVEGAQKMIDTALDRYGRLDILHNQVFGMQAGRLEDLTPEGWNETVRLTLFSVFLGIKLAVPVMRRQGGGAIVNTASVSGLRGDPGLGAYAASKAGVISLTQTAAVEYGPSNIRVNVICPGNVNSESFQQAFGEGPGSKTWLTSPTPPPERTAEQMSAARQAMADASPLKRITEPDEIARIALFLASDEASTLNGAVLVADGGLTNRSGAPAMFE
jgi:meso-butanediol dehydrogenase/(S,S)-butanediol dehydrogenase/diacetyl reductase